VFLGSSLARRRRGLSSLWTEPTAHTSASGTRRTNKEAEEEEEEEALISINALHPSLSVPLPHTCAEESSLLGRAAATC